MPPRKRPAHFPWDENKKRYLLHCFVTARELSDKHTDFIKELLKRFINKYPVCKLSASSVFKYALVARAGKQLPGEIERPGWTPEKDAFLGRCVVRAIKENQKSLNLGLLAGRVGHRGQFRKLVVQYFEERFPNQHTSVAIYNRITTLRKQKRIPASNDDGVDQAVVIKEVVPKFSDGKISGEEDEMTYEFVDELVKEEAEDDYDIIDVKSELYNDVSLNGTETCENEFNSESENCKVDNAKEDETKHTQKPEVVGEIIAKDSNEMRCKNIFDDIKNARKNDKKQEENVIKEEVLDDEMTHEFVDEIVKEEVEDNYDIIDVKSELYNDENVIKEVVPKILDDETKYEVVDEFAKEQTEDKYDCKEPSPLPDSSRPKRKRKPKIDDDYVYGYGRVCTDLEFLEYLQKALN